MKKLLVPFVLVALAAVLAAGCGGGSSKNKAYANSVSGYANAINQICAGVNSKIKALGTNTLAGIASNGDKAKSLISDGVSKVDKLQPPDQVKTAADDFVSKSKQALGMYDDLISAAKAKDTAKLQQVGAKLGAVATQTHQDARTIGAPACAHGG